MKIFYFVLLVLVVVSFAVPTLAEEEKTLFSYMDHGMLMNKIICQKVAACKKDVEYGVCLNRLDGISRALYFNKDILVSEEKSKICLDSLIKEKCEDVAAQSTKGVCASNVLK